LCPAVIRALEKKKIRTENLKAQEEIRKRAKELDEFYNMAVSRELKMIELKKEIEGLKEELKNIRNRPNNISPLSQLCQIPCAYPLSLT
jgi:predicted  nucleic acid-binding Zn-ribbon protein